MRLCDCHLTNFLNLVEHHMTSVAISDYLKFMLKVVESHPSDFHLLWTYIFINQSS